jgi:hypothetical protein
MVIKLRCGWVDTLKIVKPRPVREIAEASQEPPVEDGYRLARVYREQNNLSNECF